MAKATERLSPKATFVTKGYGQVEDNKLSAKYNGKIFAQLPCKADITLVENGMFLCYDYAHKVVSLPTAGGMEPMLVFNEVKVYDSFETDADFAMKAEKYEARVYNATADGVYKHFLPMPGTAESRTLTEYDNQTKLATSTEDSKELNPYGMMRTGEEEDVAIKSNAIVPRLFKTDVGDIMTTNCIKVGTAESPSQPGADVANLKIGTKLSVDTDGYLKIDNEASSGMIWQVVNLYTMPDLQPGVKIMRIA